MLAWWCSVELLSWCFVVPCVMLWWCVIEVLLYFLVIFCCVCVYCLLRLWHLCCSCNCVKVVVFSYCVVTVEFCCGVFFLPLDFVLYRCVCIWRGVLWWYYTVVVLLLCSYNEFRCSCSVVYCSRLLWSCCFGMLLCYFVLSSSFTDFNKHCYISNKMQLIALMFQWKPITHHYQMW